MDNGQSHASSSERASGNPGVPDDARVGSNSISAFSDEEGPTDGRYTSPPLAALGAVPADVESWHYQLQDIDPSAIANLPADMVVIDYSAESGPFTAADVDRMRRKPDGSRRIVLAYMSIGEAESYRWYWPQRSSSATTPTAFARASDG